jgi:hypothetical protein
VSKKRGPGRPRRPERLKKAPGEPVDHRLTPMMRVAILAIVEDNKSPAEAAKVAGLNGVPKALAPRSEANRNGWWSSRWWRVFLRWTVIDVTELLGSVDVDEDGFHFMIL